ncbi:type I pantothenate kinase [Leuconostoc falkenbergense]|uniref:type I pantothenate kinase n=1 Tax=Leuconostoc falkenbergense TaxID=2766470 RepID=UPI0019689D9D|nr:type I pantothenate kinase [Leuconostoc falkenbergense]QSB51844.1 type I pantothenate kinase [Leuconostoc falkenbergense]
MNELVNEILKRYQQPFMVIGVTGSVSVGKSTFANNLAALFHKENLTTSVISTDDFLMSNDTLLAAGIFEQKGFPQTYDLDRMATVIRDFKAGREQIEIPLYTQELADINPTQLQTITRPNILIVEGVTALRLPEDVLDFKIFVTADLVNIKSWYLSRTLQETALAKNDPSSWRYQYAKMPLDELSDLVMKVWDTTNQTNLDHYILPTKSLADVIVTLNDQHDVKNITYNNR